RRIFRVGELLVIALTTSFFLESVRDPRDLHSFPTRRSSDLRTRQRFRFGANPFRQRPVRPGPYVDAAACLGSAPHTLASPSAVQDRKSTRLNSSHLVTSYAVFCLKKKTSQLPQTGAVFSTLT